MGSTFSRRQAVDDANADLTKLIQKQQKAADAAPTDKYNDFPFWCGYLPDKDAMQLLNKRNDFLLRKLEADNMLCVTVCHTKNKIYDINIEQVEEIRKGQAGYKLQEQEIVKSSMKELIEFYWCTKWSISFKQKRFRLEIPILRQDWLLSSSDIKQLHELGKGSFGKVYRGELLEGGERIQCAIKQLNEEEIPDEELTSLWQEARIMKGMSDKNIVSFYGMVNDEKPFSLVIEFVNGPSVDKFLKGPGRNCDNKFRLKILIGAAKGMKYLHSQRPPFLHLDLATRNLLIHWRGILKTENNLLVKVADFGLSKRAQKENIDTSKPLNCRWMDPHSYCTETVDKLTDIWAFAITMFECFVRPFQIPYQGWGPDRVYKEILEPEGKRKRLDRPNGMPVSIYEVMKSCMHLDEKRDQRPDFEQLQVALEREYKKLEGTT